MIWPTRWLRIAGMPTRWKTPRPFSLGPHHAVERGHLADGVRGHQHRTTAHAGVNRRPRTPRLTRGASDPADRLILRDCVAELEGKVPRDAKAVGDPSRPSAHDESATVGCLLIGSPPNVRPGNRAPNARSYQNWRGGNFPAGDDRRPPLSRCRVAFGSGEDAAKGTNTERRGGPEPPGSTRPVRWFGG